jgi:filamentous hemagglutinin
LTGAERLPSPVSITTKGQEGIRYTIKTHQGNFSLRDASSSSEQSGARWTIDVPKIVSGTAQNKEIKFR